MPSMPRFSVNTLSYIVNNTFYIGELTWHKRQFIGKHKPIIDVMTFQACQDILKGKNRRVRDVNLPLAGGLFRCSVCGSALAGEQQRKKQKNGEVKEHVYYRCCNRHKLPDHPLVCWKSDKLETAIVEELKKLKLPNEEITEWFRDSLRAAMKDETTFRKDVVAQLRRRETDLEAKKNKLLDAFLAGHVEQETYQKKADELKIELERVRREMEQDNKAHEDFSDLALKVFNLSQNAAETWLGSCNSTRRELLEILCTNREADGLSLRLTWRSPFDARAKRPVLVNGVTERIRTADLLSHSQTL